MRRLSTTHQNTSSIARMYAAILMVLMICSLTAAPSPTGKVITSKALVTDVLVGVPETASYVNLEIARSGKYASWFEGIAGTPSSSPYVGYICQINPATGDLIPLSGKQHVALPKASIIPTLQWGYDSAGDYCVGFDSDGTLYRIRPNGAGAPTIDKIADPFTAEERKKIYYAYPSKNENSALQYVAYQMQDRGANVVEQRVVEISAAPLVHRAVHSEPAGPREPASFINTARWIPGTDKFTVGKYVSNVTQLLQVDASDLTVVQVTNDSRKKNDAYPYRDGGGSTHFASGFDFGAVGAIYDYLPGVERFEMARLIPFRPEQSDLARPGATMSHEVFDWGGEQWAVFQTADLDYPAAGPAPFYFTSEIWIARIRDGKAARISIADHPDAPTHPEKRTRVDAEPLVYDSGNRLAVYYHSTIPLKQGQFLRGDLRRIELGLYGDFLPRFEAGTVYPGAPSAVTSVSAASYSGASLAPEAIVAAFGSNLATATTAALTLPLPTMLAGTTVKARDGAGTERLAPLFFVSPTQVNYQMPPGTVNGLTTVTITSGDGTVSVGTVQIAAAASGLFAVDASGGGLAAATVLRGKADGSQQFEPVARFDAAQQKFVAVPIDLGPETDQVFLLLFGTGIRFRSALSAVTAKLGGVDCQVAFAGAQGGFVGLDQVNVRLSRGLIGRGEVDVALTVDGRAANTVKVGIK